MESKTCAACQRSLPASPEHFCRGTKHPDGLGYECRDCSKSSDREYYRKNADRIKERNRAYRLANQDQYRETKKRRYAKVRVLELEKQKERYQNDPLYKQTVKERVAKWQLSNPEKTADRKRAWEIKNPHVKRANKSRRRARLRTVITERVLPADVFAKTGGRCSYCGCPISLNGFHMDHAMPISRGGHHTLANLVPSCRPCNLRKGKKTADEFISATAAN